jgi:hypothetical protein
MPSGRGSEMGLADFFRSLYPPTGIQDAVDRLDPNPISRRIQPTEDLKNAASSIGLSPNRSSRTCRPIRIGAGAQSGKPNLRPWLTTRRSSIATGQSFPEPQIDQGKAPSMGESLLNIAESPAKMLTGAVTAPFEAVSHLVGTPSNPGSFARGPQNPTASARHARLSALDLRWRGHGRGARRRRGQAGVDQSRRTSFRLPPCRTKH